MNIVLTLEYVLSSVSKYQVIFMENSFTPKEINKTYNTNIYIDDSDVVLPTSLLRNLL